MKNIFLVFCFFACINNAFAMLPGHFRVKGDQSPKRLRPQVPTSTMSEFELGGGPASSSKKYNPPSTQPGVQSHSASSSPTSSANPGSAPPLPQQHVASDSSEDSSTHSWSGFLPQTNPLPIPVSSGEGYQQRKAREDAAEIDRKKEEELWAQENLLLQYNPNWKPYGKNNQSVYGWAGSTPRQEAINNERERQLNEVAKKAEDEKKRLREVLPELEANFKKLDSVRTICCLIFDSGIPSRIHNEDMISCS